MLKKDYDEIKDLIKITSQINKKELEAINRLISDIIKYNYNDEYIISMTFDRILSLVFINIEEIKNTFYKLLVYTKNINKELSEDYEKIFIEQFIEGRKEKTKKYHKNL